MTLREEFEKEILSDGVAKVFETSNQKYIEWLQRKLTPSQAHQAVIDFVADCAETLDMNADVIWGVILEDIRY